MTSVSKPNAALSRNAAIVNTSALIETRHQDQDVEGTLTILVVTSDVKLKSDSAPRKPRASAACDLPTAREPVSGAPEGGVAPCPYPPSVPGLVPACPYAPCPYAPCPYAPCPCPA